MMFSAPYTCMYHYNLVMSDFLWYCSLIRNYSKGFLVFTGNLGQVVGTSSNVSFIQSSGRPNLDSYMLWQGQMATNLKAITVCYRIKVYFFRSSVTVFSFTDNRGLKIKIGQNLESRVFMRMDMSRSNYVNVGYMLLMQHNSSL